MNDIAQTVEEFLQGMENPLEEIKKRNSDFGEEFAKKVNSILQFTSVTCGYELGTAVGLLHVALEFATMSYKNQQMEAQAELRKKADTEKTQSNPLRDSATAVKED